MSPDRIAHRMVLALLALAAAGLAGGPVVLLAADAHGLQRAGADAATVGATFTRTPGVPGASGISGVAGDAGGYVAVGSAIDPAATARNSILDAAIWHSADGQTWRLVHSEPPPPTDTPSRPGAPPVQQYATEIGSVVATSHGFVAWGSRGIVGLHGPVAAVWTSPDGVSWQRIDDPAFLPISPAAPSYDGGPASAIEDLVERDGTLLGVGEIYTHSTAPDGGQPCVWTSADGVQWQHRIVDLGPGFDPYFSTLVVHAGLVVATGRVGKYPGISWTTRDLQHWTRTTIVPQGAARVVSTPGGLFAVGETRASASVRDSQSQPTMWRSTDARHWTRVLRLAPDSQAYFTTVVPAGNELVAYGQSSDVAGRITTFVYGSADGRRWRSIDVHHAVFPVAASLQASATIGGGLAIFGSAPTGGAPPGARANYIWRAGP